MTEETGGLQFMSCKELDTTEQLIFSRKLVAGRPRVRNEVAAIEDPVPFLGLREADLEGGWALAEDLHGKQRGRLEGPLNYSARVRWNLTRYLRLFPGVRWTGMGESCRQSS